MLDYPALRAVVAVLQTGSFEKAARRLNVTPSAVSQRVRQLEERLGTILIVRGTPCTATETGDRLCRHMEMVELLESDLRDGLPGAAAGALPGQPVTIRIATSADSLATWFMDALSAFCRGSGLLVDVTIDDETHTADWLQKGRVAAAVTALGEPVPGCRCMPLGALRYHATASPEFMTRHFPAGVTPAALAAAPALTFNQKDSLQGRWVRAITGTEIALATHWLPSSHSFVAASLSGMGWGMNPAPLVADHLARGRLVELIPGTPQDIPLFWQVSRLVADRLAGLTTEVRTAARARLRPPEPA